MGTCLRSCSLCLAASAGVVCCTTEVPRVRVACSCMYASSDRGASAAVLEAFLFSDRGTGKSLWSQLCGIFDGNTAISYAVAAAEEIAVDEGLLDMLGC